MAARSLRLQSNGFAKQSADNAVSLARLQRSAGSARVSFKRRDGSSVLDGMYQSGCCKLRFPRPEPGAFPEAILINTAGGLTDGDHIATEVTWKSGTRATVTSQAAERIYKSRGEPARITNRLRVEDGATALWLPQETILFDGGKLTRRLTADIAGRGRMLACESTIFGRAAMGETVESGELFEMWRVRYGGRLVFADGFRLGGNIGAALDRPALAGGAKAAAFVIYVDADAQAMQEPLRAALDRMGCTTGCSVIGPVLVVRLLGPSGAALRRDLVSVLQVFLKLLDDGNANKTTATLPRVWSC